MNWLKHALSAAWVALTSLTIAQLNAFLGTLSLVLGIGYQVWRWRRDARKVRTDDID